MKKIFSFLLVITFLIVGAGIFYKYFYVHYNQKSAENISKSPNSSDQSVNTPSSTKINNEDGEDNDALYYPSENTTGTNHTAESSSAASRIESHTVGDVYIKMDDTDRERPTEDDIYQLSLWATNKALEGTDKKLKQLVINDITKKTTQDGTDHYTYTGYLDVIHADGSVVRRNFHGEVAKENTRWDLRNDILDADSY